jgi:hypothetical protein
MADINRAAALAATVMLTSACGSYAGDENECDGSPSAQSFAVSVEYVQASPLDPNVNFVTDQAYETWDWDGQVPDDWLEASSKIASFLKDLSNTIPDERLKAASEAAKYTDEILQFTDKWAPDLLQPYATPDLFVQFAMESPSTNEGDAQDLDLYWQGEDYVDLAQGTGVAATQDSLQAEFVATTNVPVFTEDDLFTIDIFDEDLFVDDPVGGFTVGPQWLRENAGCGPTLITSSEPEANGVWGIVVQVEGYLSAMSFE